MKNAVSLIAGILFGFGLALSQMTNPEKILDFLDFTGPWDPTLAVVLAGAVLVTVVSFRFVLRRPRPVLDVRFHLPTRHEIDRRLLAGAAIFGVGWGLAGYCPGPGVAAIAQGVWPPLVFVVGLILGTLSLRYTRRRQSETPARYPLQH